MDVATVNYLNHINREFYRVTADDFDQTRGEAWPGWERLLPYLRARHAALSCLDVGCGNGRFGVFLHKHFGTQGDITYHGMDSSTELLDRAREVLQSLPGLTVTLETRDIVENPPDAGEYDLVVLFGV